MNKRRSFVIEPGYYIARFLYEDLFFILVIVILLSLVFGIVIDAFAELRDKYLKNEKDKKDTCFICGASREQLEKKCENFNLHVMKVHNMWTYADYIIGLKFVDVQETNAINSYVIEQVEMKQTAWLPVEEEVPSEEKESM
jgi:Na+-transporting NADH:ubiquinone oxidoreductase subunit NqrC